MQRPRRLQPSALFFYLCVYVCVYICIYALPWYNIPWINCISSLLTQVNWKKPYPSFLGICQMSYLSWLHSQIHFNHGFPKQSFRHHFENEHVCIQEWRWCSRLKKKKWHIERKIIVPLHVNKKNILDMIVVVDIICTIFSLSSKK